MSNGFHRAWATIDLEALKKNLSQVRAHCPDSKVVAVVKADAYGHGMEQVARALKDSRTPLDSFAVASLEEALQLHSFDLDIPILLLSGFRNAEELAACFEANIAVVIHSQYQVELLQRNFEEDFFAGERQLWIKHNSGMNRLGMGRDDCVNAFKELHKCPGAQLVLMSHLGFADDMNASASREFTQTQIAEFNSVRDRLAAANMNSVECSMAASAGILTLPETHYDYVRPGVMLYGSSPLANETGEELGLLPVMTLRSRLIAINEVKAGASIGYCSTYVCDRDTRVGVVSIGYADGYPRSVENGTPVIVHTQAGSTRTQLIGRVSMDMLTIDLSGIEQAQVGDEVVLWGEGLCADELAKLAGTISYELFCKVTARVSYEYV